MRNTSWLYNNLKNLSGIDFPPIKEIHWFDRSTTYPSPSVLNKTKVIDRVNQKSIKTNIKHIYHLVRQRNVKTAHFYFKWYFYNYNDSWYSSLFKIYHGVKGEITPSYSILRKDDIRSMHDLSPNANLIFLIRNHIDRAWSHYRHTKKNIELGT